MWWCNPKKEALKCAHSDRVPLRAALLLLFMHVCFLQEAKRNTATSVFCLRVPFLLWFSKTDKEDRCARPYLLGPNPNSVAS